MVPDNHVPAAPLTVPLDRSLATTTLFAGKVALMDRLRVPSLFSSGTLPDAYTFDVDAPSRLVAKTLNGAVVYRPAMISRYALGQAVLGGDGGHPSPLDHDIVARPGRFVIVPKRVVFVLNAMVPPMVPLRRRYASLHRLVSVVSWLNSKSIVP